MKMLEICTVDGSSYTTLIGAEALKQLISDLYNIEGDWVDIQSYAPSNDDDGCIFKVEHICRITYWDEDDDE